MMFHTNPIFRNMSKAGLGFGLDYQMNKHKLKLREEKKRILKICVNKLQKIQDPESSLCRSVLINNMMRFLQEEHKKVKVKLKRQKNSYYDDFDTKRMCFAGHVRHNEENTADEEDIDTDDVNVDVTTPFCTLNQVILCENKVKEDHFHVLCESEQVESEETAAEDDNIINSSIDFSISALHYNQSENRCSHAVQSNMPSSTQISKSEDYTGHNVQYSDAFSSSIIHSSSISLKS